MTQLNTHFSTSNSHQTNEPDAFPSRLLTISTLQIIANSTQFTSIKSISLQTLTHLTSRYLQLLAETAKNHADHSGRHQINAWDLVGLMEALNGNGAISSLHNWCLDQYSDHHHHHHQSHSDQHLNSFSDLNLIPDETYKLKKISKTFNIHHSTISPSLNPITSLSFLPLTDSEVAELDKAGETDLDESLDTPSPAGSSSSGSSEDDSDLDIRSIKPIIEDSTMIIEPVLQACSSEALIERWRSVEDIPDFVPPYFPPLPGLEKLIHQESISSEEINPLPEPIQLELQPELDPNLSPKSDPYLTSIPYHKSQLFEQYGHQPFPRLPPTTISSASSSSPSPPNKKIKLDHHHHHHPTLKSFEETYSFYIEENRQNENVMLKPNPNRLKFLSSCESDQISNSLFTHIPIHSIKSNRWSAGWIPHPPLNLSHQGVSELRPFGHSALPIPLTISVPIEFPSPNLLIYPSQVRIPSLIPSIFRNLDEDLIHQPEGHLKHQTFTILNRFTRLGPPCELGQSGEPTSYRIKADESDPSLLHPNPNPTHLNLNEKPKYMEWGFHWPSNHGHEPFESKERQKERRGDGEEAEEEEEEEEKFVNAPFPAMPKTSVEKARILELQTLEREKEKRKENEEG
ncbi:hypothetical protein DFH28DRAFT_1217770 [Melampsora americana]|nr:hypothetical protein DFH28DRAFT_1217770 [Melampsora americana]